MSQLVVMILSFWVVLLSVWTPAVFAQAGNPSGVVTLQGNVLTDDEGPFLGLGATYMQALRHCKFDRPLLEENLAFLSERGFKFVRVLTMVAWPEQEIAPVGFNNFDDNPVEAWPDYWVQFEDLLDRVHAHGMRTEVTLFADAQRVMPEVQTRKTHLDLLVEHLAGHEHQVLLLEVANEAWQNGFPGQIGIDHLRAGGQYLSDRTSVLVSLSSPSDLFDRGVELKALYEGSAADLAIVHFGRDIRTELGGWLPVIESWSFLDILDIPLMSNEPIGPGSSVNTETDPAKLVAAAVYCWMGGLPAYVFHSSAGVFHREPFQEMEGIDDFSAILKLLPADLPNWKRNNGIEELAPFTLFNGGTPNQNWTENTSSTKGAVRNYGASKGSAFVTMPVGIRTEGVDLQARLPMRVRVHNPLTGELHLEEELERGENLHLPVGTGTWLITGELLEPTVPTTLTTSPPPTPTVSLP